MRFFQLFTISFIAFAAACTQTVVPKAYEPLDLASLPVYRYDVAEILIVEDSKPSATTKNLEIQYATSPTIALRHWVDTRIQAGGTQGSFSVIIKDANVTTRALPVEGGFMGYFKHEQAEEMHAYLNVLMGIDGSANGRSPAELNVAVRASHSLPENASQQERADIYKSLISKLKDEFNKEAEKQLNAYFQPYRVAD